MWRVNTRVSEDRSTNGISEENRYEIGPIVRFTPPSDNGTEYAIDQLEVYGVCNNGQFIVCFQNNAFVVNKNADNTYGYQVIVVDDDIGYVTNYRHLLFLGLKNGYLQCVDVNTRIVLFSQLLHQHDINTTHVTNDPCVGVVEIDDYYLLVTRCGCLFKLPFAQLKVHQTEPVALEEIPGLTIGNIIHVDSNTDNVIILSGNQLVKMHKTMLSTHTTVCVFHDSITKIKRVNGHVYIALIANHLQLICTQTYLQKTLLHLDNVVDFAVIRQPNVKILLLCHNSTLKLVNYPKLTVIFEHKTTSRTKLFHSDDDVYFAELTNSIVVKYIAETTALERLNMLLRQKKFGEAEIFAQTNDLYDKLPDVYQMEIASLLGNANNVGRQSNVRCNDFYEIVTVLNKINDPHLISRTCQTYFSDYSVALRFLKYAQTRLTTFDWPSHELKRIDQLIHAYYTLELIDFEPDMRTIWSQFVASDYSGVLLHFLNDHNDKFGSFQAAAMVVERHKNEININLDSVNEIVNILNAHDVFEIRDFLVFIEIFVDFLTNIDYIQIVLNSVTQWILRLEQFPTEQIDWKLISKTLNVLAKRNVDNSAFKRVYNAVKYHNQLNDFDVSMSIRQLIDGDPIDLSIEILAKTPDGNLKRILNDFIRVFCDLNISTIIERIIERNLETKANETLMCQLTYHIDVLDVKEKCVKILLERPWSKAIRKLYDDNCDAMDLSHLVRFLQIKRVLSKYKIRNVFGRKHEKFDILKIITANNDLIDDLAIFLTWKPHLRDCARLMTLTHLIRVKSNETIDVYERFEDDALFDSLLIQFELISGDDEYTRDFFDVLETICERKKYVKSERFERIRKKFLLKRDFRVELTNFFDRREKLHALRACVSNGECRVEKLASLLDVSVYEVIFECVTLNVTQSLLEIFLKNLDDETNLSDANAEVSARVLSVIFQNGDSSVFALTAEIASKLITVTSNVQIMNMFKWSRVFVRADHVEAVRNIFKIYLKICELNCLDGILTPLQHEVKVLLMHKQELTLLDVCDIFKSTIDRADCQSATERQKYTNFQMIINQLSYKSQRIYVMRVITSGDFHHTNIHNLFHTLTEPHRQQAIKSAIHCQEVNLSKLSALAKMADIPNLAMRCAWAERFHSYDIAKYIQHKEKMIEAVLMNVAIPVVDVVAFCRDFNVALSRCLEYTITLPIAVGGDVDGRTKRAIDICAHMSGSFLEQLVAVWTSAKGYNYENYLVILNVLNHLSYNVPINYELFLLFLTQHTRIHAPTTVEFNASVCGNDLHKRRLPFSHHMDKSTIKPEINLTNYKMWVFFAELIDLEPDKIRTYAIQNAINSCEWRELTLCSALESTKWTLSVAHVSLIRDILACVMDMCDWTKSLGVGNHMVDKLVPSQAQVMVVEEFQRLIERCKNHTDANPATLDQFQTKCLNILGTCILAKYNLTHDFNAKRVTETITNLYADEKIREWYRNEIDPKINAAVDEIGELLHENVNEIRVEILNASFSHAFTDVDDNDFHTHFSRIAYVFECFDVSERVNYLSRYFDDEINQTLKMDATINTSLNATLLNVNNLNMSILDATLNVTAHVPKLIAIRYILHKPKLVERFGNIEYFRALDRNYTVLAALEIHGVHIADERFEKMTVPEKIALISRSTKPHVAFRLCSMIENERVFDKIPLDHIPLHEIERSLVNAPHQKPAIWSGVIEARVKSHVKNRIDLEEMKNVAKLLMQCPVVHQIETNLTDLCAWCVRERSHEYACLLLPFVGERARRKTLDCVDLPAVTQFFDTFDGCLLTRKILRILKMAG